MEHCPSPLRAIVFAGALLAACSSTNTPPPSEDAGPTDTGVADLGVTDVPVTDRGMVTPDTGTPDAGGSRCGQFPMCNVVTNAGCGAGQGCYAVGGGDAGLSAQCAMSGRAGWDEPCMTADGCREGFACLGSPGRCTRLCCGTENSICRDETHGGRPGAICAGVVTGTDIKFCVDPQSCDPYATSNNRCPAEMPRCDVIGADGTTSCRAVRASPAPGTDGARCCMSIECAPGFLCIGMASGGMCNPASPSYNCRRVCNPTVRDGGVACPSGQMCNMLNGQPETYGVCVPPMM
jgi:hypothetical protein